MEIPFIYSLLVIPFSSSNDLPYEKLSDGSYALNPDIFTLIFVFGIVGGALSIVDPFGKLCKGILRINCLSQDRIKFGKKSPTERKDGNYLTPEFLFNIRKNFIKHGSNTLPINTEINKIVGMCYFVSLLIIFGVFLHNESYEFFTESLIGFNFYGACELEKNELILNTTKVNEGIFEKCITENSPKIKDYFLGFFFVLSGIVIIIIVISIDSLFKKNRTASIYLYAISHQPRYVAKRDISEMETAMREGRWELAEEWSHYYYKIHVKGNGKLQGEENDETCIFCRLSDKIWEVRYTIKEKLKI